MYVVRTALTIYSMNCFYGIRKEGMFLTPDVASYGTKEQADSAREKAYENKDYDFMFDTVVVTSKQISLLLQGYDSELMPLFLGRWVSYTCELSYSHAAKGTEVWVYMQKVGSNHPWAYRDKYGNDARGFVCIEIYRRSVNDWHTLRVVREPYSSNDEEEVVHDCVIHNVEETKASVRKKIAFAE